MIGRRLGHYLILEPLGAGGMGVVYRARDERLERDVAIKTLPAGALADEAARKQFRKEALALSSLNHPNIETVHDFDTEDGVDFLVMELIPGQTLSDRIAAGPLPEEEIARLGEQLAEGLSAAHREGILHRDIKPSNLRITPQGRLKILDFGLAKLARPADPLSPTQTLTAGDRAAGTLPYMSPEQLRGGRLDPRSDLHAAGAVLYEMACGRRAFPQEAGPAVIGAILGQPPTSPHEIFAGVSSDMERIVLRCLEKDPAHRYASGEELAGDLRQIALPASQRHLAKARRSRRGAKRIAVAAGVGTAAAALVLTLNVGGLRDRVLGGGATTIRSLAVLPLVNLSGDPDQEFFADGMTDELITRLAQVGAMRVISRSSAMQYKGTKKPLREIAKELNVEMVVQGSVIRSGDMVRISAQLVDALKDRHLWAESYERTLSNVLALQSEVARAIVASVRVKLTPEERERLKDAPDVDPEANKAYLKGRFAHSQMSGEALRRAVEFFQEAIQIDPNYAPAYAGLADSYSFLSGNYLPTDEAVPRARAAATKALELDPELASAHAALGYLEMFYDWNWQAAEEEFRRALELNPGEVGALQNYGALLVALGRFDEASRQLARAREIDPLSPLLAAMSLWPLFEGRQFDRAAIKARELSDADRNAWVPRLILGQALLFQGNNAAAIAEIKKSAELDPTSPFALGWLGYAYGVSGDRRQAVEMLERLRVWSRKSYIQPYLFLLVHIGLGEKETALDWLEKAAEARSDELFFLKVDPAMDPLRSEPRFQAVLDKMNFPA